MNIGIIGYGKMGKEVEKMAIKKGHQIIYKINSKNQHILSERNTPKVDVAIEFSQPDSACKNINLCINNKTPVVCGTTGWANHISKVEKLCLQKNSTFLYAPNFSIGMNLFFEISNYMSKLMMGKNYNPLIEEKHHKMKQDIPSGTAIKIAHDIYENYKTIHQTQKTPIK